MYKTEHFSLAMIDENTDAVFSISQRIRSTAWNYTNLPIGAIVVFTENVFVITAKAADWLFGSKMFKYWRGLHWI
ncbi:MAG: hypothetical protein IC227_06630 [Enterococcus lacertideformus]|uniref:Uncharacterized protein n=1 Tax=Enterococcus lacertideformus TaxID=2771493 RepID=A0A931AVW2_9ENTE|nr:hypothetical protein [Enterococcus lacertideformus]